MGRSAIFWSGGFNFNRTLMDEWFLKSYIRRILCRHMRIFCRVIGRWDSAEICTCATILPIYVLGGVAGPLRWSCRVGKHTRVCSSQHWHPCPLRIHSTGRYVLWQRGLFFNYLLTVGTHLWRSFRILNALMLYSSLYPLCRMGTGIEEIVTNDMGWWGPRSSHILSLLPRSNLRYRM